MEIKRKGLFGPGAFYRRALAIAVPIMLQQLIQSLVWLKNLTGREALVRS